jgi:hypothetical protein
MMVDVGLKMIEHESNSLWPRIRVDDLGRVRARIKKTASSCATRGQLLSRRQAIRVVEIICHVEKADELPAKLVKILADEFVRLTLEGLSRSLQRGDLPTTIQAGMHG